jgi:hypothetical protein
MVNWDEKDTRWSAVELKATVLWERVSHPYCSNLGKFISEVVVSSPQQPALWLCTDPSQVDRGYRSPHSELPQTAHYPGLERTMLNYFMSTLRLLHFLRDIG